MQSETRQPFNVVVNKKVFSSTSTGYVIIPKLAAGSYNIIVGFAPGTFPDQSFNINIDKKDLGYSLKNFSEKGWGLFNLQSFGITYAGTPSGDVAAVEPPKPVAQKKEEFEISFNKPAVKSAEVPITKPDVLQDLVNNTKAEEVKTGSKTAVASSPVDSLQKQSEGKQNNDKSNVTKVSETSGDDGVSLTYVDNHNLKSDTVQVIIPVNKPTRRRAEEKKAEEKKAEEKSETVSNPATDVRFIEGENSKNIKSETATSSPSEAVATNPNCKETASDEDYTKLRRRMARETSDEKMITEATRALKNKCFTTSQVKALSTLFLSDEGRFNFFNATYTLVADPQSYESLEKEFVDPAFSNRFRAMLKS